jgi:broad specificity phosphatase PhoE
MTARLLLLRHAPHGDVGLRLTGRADGHPLTEDGARAAEALGRRLADQGIAEVLTSPRLRARQTAEAVAGAAGAPLREEEALDEVDFGRWTGLAFEDLSRDPEWETWNRARGSARAPGGEGMAEVAARVRALAERVGEADGTRALVTHADVIRALVASVLGLHLDHLLRFEVAPASVSAIEVAPWGLALLGLNDTGTPGGGR